MNAHGADLTRDVVLCVMCGERPFKYQGKRCWQCWRESSGFTPGEFTSAFVRPVEEVPAWAEAPEPKPLPRATTKAAPPKSKAAPAPRPPPVRRVVAGRLCQWPGCERRHAKRGACSRDYRRLVTMEALDTDPATWPGLWEAYQLELAELASFNGRAHTGLSIHDKRPALTLAQWRKLR